MKSRSDWVGLLAIMVLPTLVACNAHYPINPPLSASDNRQSSYLAKHNSSPESSESLAVFLAFSGGGTRAAALSYGVLEALAGMQIEWEGKPRSLLDEVDLISGVSGGSVTAAYYGLYGSGIFDNFETDFLKHDVQGDLTRRAFSPVNWFKLASDFYGLSEMAAEYYDQNFFHDATFSDLQNIPGPAIHISATEAVSGLQFQFSPNTFSMICSDLDQFPLSRAVTASSAVPLVFNSVIIRNYAGSCSSGIPRWIDEYEDGVPIDAQTKDLISRYKAFLDREKKPYLHLFDGGMSDNLGIRPLLTRLELADDAWELVKIRGFAKVKRILVIVVNSMVEIRDDLSKQEASLDLDTVFRTLSTIPLNAFSYESMRLLEKMSTEISRQIAAGRCAESKRGGLTNPDCGDILTYIVEVNFNHIQNAGDRDYLKQLPTSFSLSDEDVDRLRFAAHEMLQNSADLQRFFQELK